MSWDYMPEYRPINHDPLVVELETAFGHYHLTRNVEQPGAVCGKRGRITRLLPFSSWEGAPGQLPTTFCGRCSKLGGIGTRKDQVEMFKLMVTLRLTETIIAESMETLGEDAVSILAELGDDGVLTPEKLRAVESWREHFESRGIAGEGYVDLDAEIEKMRRARDHHGCFLDWLPAGSILFARAGA